MYLSVFSALGGFEFQILETLGGRLHECDADGTIFMSVLLASYRDRKIAVRFLWLN
jgi:hypothetical protein